MTYLAYDIAPKKNKAFTCKTNTLGSLYSHAVLILTETSKSKIKWCMKRSLKIPQVAHEKLVHKRGFFDLELKVH